MNAVDVKCPICGTINKSLDLEETDGWMECESCGNTNTFQYGEWRLESITDGAGRVTQFIYTNNMLSGILAPGETAPVTLEYYNNMRLNGIVDADGERTSISWTQVAGEFGSDDYVESIGNRGDGRYLEFTYPYAMPH